VEIFKSQEIKTGKNYKTATANKNAVLWFTPAGNKEPDGCALTLLPPPVG